MDEALTQGCSIEWADDDSKTPHKSANLHLLFQSPTPQSSVSLKSHETASTSETTKSSVAIASITSPLGTQPMKSVQTKERRLQEEVDFIFSVLEEGGDKDETDTLSKLEKERKVVKTWKETPLAKTSNSENVLSSKEFHAMLNGVDDEISREEVEKLKDRRNIGDRTSKRLFDQYSSDKQMKKLKRHVCDYVKHQQTENAAGVSSFDDLLLELKHTSDNKHVHDSTVKERNCQFSAKQHVKCEKAAVSNEIRHSVKETFESNQSTSMKNVYLSNSVQNSGAHKESEVIQHEFDDIEFDDDVFAAVDAAIQHRQTQTCKNIMPSAKPQEELMKVERYDSMSPRSKIAFHRSPTLPTSNRSIHVVTNRDQHSTVGGQSYDPSCFTSLNPPTYHQTVNVMEDDLADLSMVDFDKIDELVAQRDNMKNNERHDQEFPSCSRYRIFSIENDISTFRKIVGVCSWTDSACMASQNRKSDLDAKGKGPDGFIHLLGEWYFTECQVGDVIHICSLSGRFNTEPSSLPLELNTASADNDIVFILHPDDLITPNTISETVSCLRRAILKTKYGSGGFTNKSALIGKMRHDFFERCLIHNNFTKAFAHQEVPHIVREHGDHLIGAGLLDEKAIVLEVIRMLPNIQRFAATYTIFMDGNGRGKLNAVGNSPAIDICTERIEGTEELIVSTELGIKGFIDTTAKVTAFEPTSNLRDNTENAHQSYIMGIELKTGHNQTPQNVHMAQLALYSMALRTRYGSSEAISKDREKSKAGSRAGKGGMLLYLNSENVNAVHVLPKTGELKSLLSHRNYVATELRRATAPRGVLLEYSDDSKEDRLDAKRIKILPATPAVFPDLLHSSHSCERCYANRECMLNAAVENMHSKQLCDNRKTHRKLIDHFTNHLSTTDLKYFLDWDRLIDLEASSSSNNIAKAWLRSSQELEATTGKSISSLVIENQTLMDVGNLAGKEDANFFFICSRSVLSKSDNPLNGLKFEIGSRVVLSTDGISRWSSSTGRCFTKKQIFGLARASVNYISEHSIHIQVSHADYLRISRLIEEGSSENLPTLFRIDKDDAGIGFSTLRQNLLNLFTADVLPYSTKTNASQETLINTQHRLRARAPSLRRSIVHLDRPQFDLLSIDQILNQPAFADLAKDFSDLNEDQKAAACKVINARSYSLIQGFPGTGKTSTIVFIARLLVAMGKRILVTSYTHAAVDNILIKLIERTGCKCAGLKSENVVRVGSKTSVHPSLHSYLAHEVACERDRQDMIRSNSVHEQATRLRNPSIENLHKAISAANVVGVSALTIPKTPLLIGQEFDLVIVDEAGQISQPAIIGALLAADKFVLVGDHEQLPPLVQNEMAEEAGYSESMLKRLADRHPESVAQLTLQYRMNEDICLLSNILVYKGALKCADDSIRKRKLSLPGFPLKLKSIVRPGNNGVGWLLPVLNPNKNVVFVNTDYIGQNLESCVTNRDSGIAGGGVINDTEIEVAKVIIHGMLVCGLDATSIGVIGPYRAQVNRFNEDPFISAKAKEGLEISTIDRYQGRDKDAMIVSLARSNEAGRTGRLLEDKRRLNVAFSRAKRKLIIIASYDTLFKGSAVLTPLLQEIKMRNWVETPSLNATKMYNIPVPN